MSQPDWFHEYDDDYVDGDSGCSWCGGDGVCTDGVDPLGDCPDEAHRCHACGGTGLAKDQTVW